MKTLTQNTRCSFRAVSVLLCVMLMFALCISITPKAYAAADTTPPVIALNVPNPTPIPYDDLFYTWEHVTAVDDVDGDVPYRISNGITTRHPGTQKITITATDKAGNKASLDWYLLVVDTSWLNDGDFYYTIVDGSYAALVGYAGANPDVVIPATLGGYPLKKVGGFAGCSYVNSIVIPSGVTTITVDAFRYLRGLSITIPESVVKIESGALSYCEQTTIYGVKGSVAEEEARVWGLFFKEIARTSSAQQAQVSAIRATKTSFVIQKGKTLTIPFTYDLTVDTSAKPKFKWSSSNPKYVSVTQTGKVKGLKTGKSAKIKVSSDNGKSKTFTVKVLNDAIQVSKISIKAPPKTMKVGQGKVLKVKVSPSNATGVFPTFKLDSKSKKIVRVDKVGKVTAIKNGTAKITVKAGNKKTVITVKVRR